MSLRIGSLAFLAVAVAAGAMALFVESTRDHVLPDVIFLTSVAGFLVCGIGDLARRAAEITTAGRDEPRRDG